MQNTNRNTKYKMPCHVPQAQIKKEVLKDKLQIKNPKHKYDVRQTYQNKPTKPNQTQPTKHTEPNLANQNYWSKQSTPGSVVPLAMFKSGIEIAVYDEVSDLMLNAFAPC